MAEIGARINLEGGDQFARSMKDITSELKLLSSELKLQEAQYKASGDAQTYYTERSATLQKEIAAQQEKLGLMAQELQKLNQMYPEGGAKVDEYQTKINAAQTALVTMQNQLREAEQGLQSAGEAAGQAGEGMDEAADSAGEMGDAAGSLASTIKEQLVSNLQGAIDTFSQFGQAVKNVLTGIWDMGKASSEFADDLATTATVTGLSVEQLQAFAYAARFVDTEVDTLTGAMTKMTVNMASGSKTAQAAFETLGVAVRDSNGNLRDQQVVFTELITALGNVENETQRDALAMQIFGKSAKDLNPLIEAGADAWNQYCLEAKEAGLILSEEGVQALGSFNDSLQRMDATFEATQHQLMAALAPAFEKIADVVTEVAQKFSAWVQTDEAQELLGKLADLVIKLAQDFADNLGPAIEGAMGILEGIGSVIDFVTEHAQFFETAILALVTAFGVMKAAMAAIQIVELLSNPITAAAVAIAAAVALIVTNWEPISEFFRNLWEQIVGFFTQAWESIKQVFAPAIEYFTMIWENIKQVFSVVGDVLSGDFEGAWQGIQNIWDNVVGYFQGVWEGISGAFSTVGDWFTQIFTDAWTGIQNAWASVTQWFTDIWTSISDTFSVVDSFMSEHFGGAWEAIKSIWDSVVGYFQMIWDNIQQIFSVVTSVLSGDFEGAWNAIQNIWNNVTGYFQQVWENIKNAFGNAIQWFTDLGKNLLEGLWNGLKQKLSALKDKICGVFRSIVDWGKSIFGVASPSKVFRDEIGRWLPLGMAEGILDEIPAVERAMSRMMDSAMPDPASASISYRPAALSDAAVQSIANAVSQRGDIILRLNDRELGRAVRSFT